MEEKVNAALTHNIPNWCMWNACPTCFCKLEDEPPLGFFYLASINGNNSLKRWHFPNSFCVNSRKLCSDYWISQQDVDHFKDEVKAKAVSKVVLLLHFVNVSSAWISCMH